MSGFYRARPVGTPLSVLHIDLREDPDRARLEPVIALLLVEEFEHAYDGAYPARTFLLPVPVSLCSNSFSDLPDLAAAMAGRWWEVRGADPEAAERRLRSALTGLTGIATARHGAGRFSYWRRTAPGCWATTARTARSGRMLWTGRRVSGHEPRAHASESP